MTGPEHYAEAEKCLAAMNGKGQATCQVLLGQAQVHATLALAAATGLQGIQGNTETLDYADWMEATQ